LWRAGLGELLIEDELLHGAEPGAAVFHRPGGGDPAAVGQLLTPLAASAAFELEAGASGLRCWAPRRRGAGLVAGEGGVGDAAAALELFGELLVEEVAYFAAPGGFFGCVVESHVVGPFTGPQSLRILQAIAFVCSALLIEDY
jgi:hypothetical protein